MRFRIVTTAGLLASMAGALQAQGAAANTNCKALTADACQQTVDLLNYMVPQIGTAMAGGNTTLAQGGTLGWRTVPPIPHFAVDVRFSVVLGNLPTLQTPAVTLPAATAPPASRAFLTSTAPVPFPAVDAAIGVWKGFPVGVSTMGGVDLLLSASYIPSGKIDVITLEPDASLKIGYGVRVGILQESLTMPGVGFSYIKRGTPKTTIKADAGSGATKTVLEIKDLELDATSWRFTVSKSLFLFGVSAGVGQDKYDATTTIALTPPAPATMAPFVLDNAAITRTNYFADLSMNLLILKIVAGGGMVSGGDITTYNSFDVKPDKSRMYGTVGVRLGL